MITVDQLSYRYGARQALAGVGFSIQRSEIFGLLGPNGSGKTTLLRILATLMLPQGGRAEIEGFDLAREVQAVRRRIGVVFQSPSLDIKLTVAENLRHQAHLYGLSGLKRRERCAAMLERLGIQDRAGERVEKLSGGLKRRVELAKGLLHKPGVLLLDEPSTGLDPGARLDLWRYLKKLREQESVTILVATHLMEEAEQCDRLAVMREGNLVALGSPEALKKEIGGDVLVIQGEALPSLAQEVEARLQVKPKIVGGTLQIEHKEGHRFIAQLVEAFPGKIHSVTFRKPTLEDVFIHHTGHRFWAEAGTPA